MTYEMDGAATARLWAYFGRIGTALRDKRKRASFATYAFGILGNAERKSAEPIAAVACGDPERADPMHQRMLHFLSDSVWDDRRVRGIAASHALDAISAREPVTTWIVDDTGFLKQGTHSVGVQRQYTGSAGKTTNCQIGVSLTVATATEHLPIDFELYLPHCWTDDPKKRREGRIPDDVQFQTKLELALGMIRRAKAAGIPGNTLLVDSAYGESNEFRDEVRSLGFDYAVGVHAPTKVLLLRDNDSHRSGPRMLMSAEELGIWLGPGAYRRITWRDGTKSKLSSRFCMRRVKIAHDDGTDVVERLAAREPLWLLIEWPKGEPKPTKFILTTLPRRMSKKRLVRLVKERWRTERAYEDLKGELGLDHFEGRSFPGWHHHVSVVLCCYAFVVAERARAFSPSQGRQATDRPNKLAA
jgi:SRSO17 transposase